MNIIVAVDKNWAIGKNSDLLLYNPKDMQFFKEKTIGNTVIMGRKTLESFPEGKPLKDRNNIVLTTQDLEREGVTVAHSKAEVHEMVGQIENQDSIYIIGGAQVYKEFLEDCSKVYVTWIDYAFDAPDVYFPNLDEKKEWELEFSSNMEKYGDFKYCFRTYVKAKE